MAVNEKIEVQNFTSPNHIQKVDRAKYEAMRAAVMAHVPNDAPGATPAVLIDAVKPDLPQELFPGGEKAGWWFKCVQLDLEAKGILVRAEKPPVRLRKV